MTSHLEEGVQPFTWPSHYLLQLPGPAPAAATSTERPAPLVVALHGMGMDDSQMLDRLGLGDGPRALLVPTGMYPFEQRAGGSRRRIGHAWYLYTGDQPAFREQLERSEDHVVTLVDRILDDRPIDRRRVTLLGYSQGGYLAGFVALRHPDRFAGLVLLSSRLKHEFLGDELAAGHLPRVLFVHSTVDPSVAWESAEPGIGALRAGGAEVTVELHDEGHRLPKDLGTRLGAWLDAAGL